MAATAPTPLSEYLATTYRPDREYINGELRERHTGKWENARLQLLLAAWFFNHEAAWQIISSTEQRLQTAAGRVGIPDLVVLRPGPQPDVLVDPPLLVIEILSPDDTYSDLQSRARDYQDMGVETVWIIDTTTRSGRMCVGSQWLASPRLEVAGTPLFVDLGPLFDQIGERR